MTRFLLEVPHEAEKVACLRAIQTFLQTGSHFLANADWGCSDGEHKAWLILEGESREDLLFALPPSIRPQAKIVRLDKYSLKDVEEAIRYHQG
jgi:hypothetical protein